MSENLNLDTKIASLEGVTGTSNQFHTRYVDLMRSGLRSNLNPFGEAASKDVVATTVQESNDSDIVPFNKLSSSFITRIGSGNLYGTFGEFNTQGNRFDLGWTLDSVTLSNYIGLWSRNTGYAETPFTGLSNHTATVTSSDIILNRPFSYYIMAMKFYTGYRFENSQVSSTISHGNLTLLPVQRQSSSRLFLDGSALRSGAKPSSFTSNQRFPGGSAFTVFIGETDWLMMCTEADTHKLRISPGRSWSQLESSNYLSMQGKFFCYTVEVWGL